MNQLLAMHGVTDIMVWLSELAAPCHCEQCRGEDAFVNEVRGIDAAFSKARANHPGASLRILTTQGSYDVNDKVLIARNPETKITFYSGVHTYDSSRKTMIYPLLEKWTESGQWLGVYPQIINSWTSCFPLTGARFMHFRMNEFADKKLASCSGYTRSSIRYYDFNVTALGEWGWNAKGRSPKELLHAYAAKNRLPEREKFVEWGELIGQLEWDIAGSNTVMTMLREPGRMLYEKPDIKDSNALAMVKRMEFGKRPVSEFRSASHLAQDIELAGRALNTAVNIGSKWIEAESRSIQALLNLIKAVYDLTNQTAGADPGTVKIDSAERILATIDDCAKILAIELDRWGRFCNPWHESEKTTINADTLEAGSAVADYAWKLGRALNINDPYPAHRTRKLKDWNAKELSAGNGITVRAETSECLEGNGSYIFNLNADVKGLKITGAELISTDPGGGRRVEEAAKEISLTHACSTPGANNQYRLKLNNFDLNRRYFVEFHLPAEGNENYTGATGIITVRKSWLGS